METAHSVGPEYCGLVVAVRHDPGLAEVVVAAMESAQCHGWVLQSVRHVLAIGQVGLHPESLFGALSSAHGATDVHTAIVGRLSGRHLELGQPCMAFRIPADVAISQDLIATMRRATSDAVVALLDPVEDDVWAIAPSVLLLDADELSALAEFEFDSGLVVTTVTQGAATSAESRSARVYDPLEAQLREVFNSRSGWLVEESSRIEAASLSIGLAQVGRSVACAIRDIVGQLVATGWQAHELFESQEERDAMLRYADMTSQAFELLTQWLAGVRAVLVDNGASATVHGDARYSGKSRKATILAANALARELGDRLSECGSPTFLVSYGQYFTVSQMSRGLEWLGLGFAAAPDVDNLPDVVNLPEWCSGRLGALPVLAHEAGHSVAGRLSEEAFMGLLLEVERLHGASAWEESDDSRFQFDHKARAEAAGRMSVLRNWTDELVADLIACSLCGPAFLFAFARFALGGLHAMGSDAEFETQTHPRMSARLRTCEWALQRWGFEVELRSTLLPDEVPLLVEDENLIHVIREAVARPYGVAEHARAVGVVETALHHGNLVEAEPTLLLNALWHSVVNGTGYANEIALAYSLLHSRPGGPTMASTSGQDRGGALGHSRAVPR